MKLNRFLPDPPGRTRIVFILNQMGMGGSERQLWEVTSALKRSGRYLPFIVFFGRHREFLDKHGFPGIPVTHVPKYRRAWWPGDWFDFRNRLARFLTRVRPALVVTWNASAGFWGAWGAIRAKVPRIALSERTVFYPIRKKDRLRERFIVPHVDGMILNSHTGVEWAATQKNYPRHKIHVLENGIDLSRFADLDANAIAGWRQRFLPDGKGLLIGVLARLYVEKNHALLLESLSRIASQLPQPWHLLLMGDGKRRAELVAHTERLGLSNRVTFQGDVAPADVPAALSACDFTVLPSDREGFPNAVLESLAAGVPVIATDISDNARLVQAGKTGRLVPKGDVDSLAAALLDAGRNWQGPARDAMAGHAREVAAYYGRDGLIQRATALFDRLTTLPPRRRYARAAAVEREEDYVGYWPPPAPVQRVRNDP